MNHVEPALMSVKTAAMRLSCSEEAIRTWLRQRSFQRIKVGSPTRIKSQEVDACIRLGLQPQETY